MKIWKKILIVALCVLAVSAFVFVGMLCYAYYEKYHQTYYWESVNEQLSDNIVMEHGHKGQESFVRLKDKMTGKYTTPKLQHIYLNEFDVEDSLVVFRTQDRLRGYLNTRTGKIVIDAQYERAWNFSEGVAAALKDGVVSFINEDGSLAFPNTFPIRYDDDYSEIAFQFHNGICVMRTMDNKWGLIDKQGEWIIEPLYSTIDAPYHGFRRACDGLHYGLLTNDGTPALPFEYDDIRRASDGRGWILVKDGLAKEVDFQFQVLVPFMHDGLHYLSYIDSYGGYEEESEPVQPRFYRFDIGSNSGVVDAKGKVIIPAIYYNVRMVNEHLFEVEVTYDGERILMDTKGRYVDVAGI